MLTKITFSLKYFSHIDLKIIKYLLQIIISCDFIVLGLISSLLKLFMIGFENGLAQKGFFTDPCYLCGMV
jgi:hypothetical protein